MELAPDLPRDVAEMLVSGADSTLKRFIKDEGITEMSRIRHMLANAIQFDTKDNFVRCDSLIRPLINRIRKMECLVLGDSISKFEDIYNNYTLEQRWMTSKIRFEQGKVFKDTLITDIEKIERFRELLAESKEYDLFLLAAQCKSTIADLYLNIGAVDSSMCYYRSALADCRNLDYCNMSCHVLGVMGCIYEDRGQIDSMVACWEEVKRLARQKLLPGQLARMHCFYAGHYKRRGRLSLSHELFNQALEVYRPHSDSQAFAYLFGQIMRFHAELEAWEIVGRLLPQARAAEKIASLDPPVYQIRNSLEISQMEARYFMAMGWVTEAESIFNEIKKPVQNLPWPMIYIELLRNWARGLLQNKQYANALSIIEEGYQLSQNVDHRELSSQFLIMSAEAYYELGHLDACEAKLEMFEKSAAAYENNLKHEWSMRDALCVKMNLAEGNNRGAAKALEEGVARLEGFSSRTDAGVYGYLWLGKNDAIRQMLHNCVEEDPLAGYGVEFYWRDLYRLLGGSSEKKKSQKPAESSPVTEKQFTESSLLEQLITHGEAARSRVMQRNAIHCVYLQRNGAVWRWTCSREGIRRDILNFTTDRLKELVSQTWEKMARDPGGENTSVDQELSRDLEILSQVLLPAEVFGTEAEDPARLLLISTDGFLSRFPFETLNIGDAADYVPLLKEHDIAYVRHTDQYIPSDESLPGIILANNRGGGMIRGKYVEGRELDNIRAEGKAVCSLKPGSLFLYGEEATKASLLAGWEHASFLYFAAHIIRDTDVPFLALLPMADPGVQSAPEAAYLDMSDIRSASLSQCEVAVLSGCSSGSPYIGVRNAAPSLGDAFLDAGVGAVIQTFWDIRDDQAKELMSSFVTDWGTSSTPSHLIKVLCNVRRKAMQGSEGIRSPFSWAAYSINVGRF